MRKSSLYMGVMLSSSLLYMLMVLVYFKVSSEALQILLTVSSSRIVYPTLNPFSASHEPPPLPKQEKRGATDRSKMKFQ